MTNELLRNCIVKILYRVHPAPLRKRPLAAECEIALGATLTVSEFDAELSSLRRENLVACGRDGILGEVTAEMAAAIGRSPAHKILIPSLRCGVTVAGTAPAPLADYIAAAVKAAVQFVQKETQP